MAQSRGRSRRSREVRVAPRAHRPFCTSQATRFGERHVLVPLGLCSLLGSITVLCASAFVQFIGRLIGAADFDQLRTPAFYLVAAVLVATGVLQACPPPSTHTHTRRVLLESGATASPAQVYFLQEALHHHDSTTVVPVYYMTFTLAAVAMPGARRPRASPP